MTLWLIREPTVNQTTLGVLFVNGHFLCFTLEDAIRDVKIPHETCIPPGTYPIKLTFSQRFQRVLPEVLNVPNFTGVRLHPGNTVGDTDGCILCGLQRASASILNSRDAHQKLEVLIREAEARGENVRLVIENPKALTH